MIRISAKDYANWELCLLRLAGRSDCRNTYHIHKLFIIYAQQIARLITGFQRSICRICILCHEGKRHKKSLQALACKDFGGAKGIRTPDLYNANVARYQLCYSPLFGNFSDHILHLVGFRCFRGRECTSGSSSYQLCYSPEEYTDGRS